MRRNERFGTKRRLFPTLVLLLSFWSVGTCLLGMGIMNNAFSTADQPAESGHSPEKIVSDFDLRRVLQRELVNFVLGHRADDTLNQPKSTVQRIYYINLEKNVKRRSQMEGWLTKQSIPYQRVSATVASDDDPEACVQRRKGRKEQAAVCRGISGLVMSELNIIRNFNTSGLTLVFEDDYIPKFPLALDYLVERSLELVPADWDIIRFDCWGDIPSTYNVVQNGKTKVFRTASTSHSERFAGGAHFMVWRDSSTEKLESVWSQQPYDYADVMLSTDKLNSYCIKPEPLVGDLVQPTGELTDLPKTPK